MSQKLDLDKKGTDLNFARMFVQAYFDILHHTMVGILHSSLGLQLLKIFVGDSKIQITIVSSLKHDTKVNITYRLIGIENVPYLQILGIFEIFYHNFQLNYLKFDF